MNFLSFVTVEPSLLIYLVVYEWLGDLNTNLLLQKSCRFNRMFEPDLSTKCDDEKQGILFVSEVNVKFSSFILLFGAAFAIFAMPWSDKAGRRRRPLIFFPIIGLILHTMSSCLHSYFWHWAPMSAAICSAILSSLGGGPMLLMPACSVYLCDICSAENRTIRLGIAGAVSLLSQILGKGGSGVILRKFGFFYSYLWCFAFAVSSLIIGLILIKDTSVKVEKKIPLRSLFTNIGRDLVDNFRVVFRKSLGTKRIVIALLIISNVAIIFTYYGEISVMYQYLRYRFEWSEQTYSHYMFYKFSTSALGILFCCVILSKIFNVHDGLLGILAGSFDIIAVSWLLVANKEWQIYLLPLIDIFHGTVTIIGMSFMSKFYHANELGRLSAVNSIFSLPMALSFPAYNGIYSHTLDTFPSAFCFLSIALDIFILVCFCGAYFLSRSLDKYEEKSKISHPGFLEDNDLPVPAYVDMKS